MGGTADEYATAAKAMDMFGATRYDLIVMHWHVYPGQRASDPKVRELAAMIPVVHLNRNVLYWETALRDHHDTVKPEKGEARCQRLVSRLPRRSQSTRY